MDKSNQKKKEQLGMSIGTASNQLKKNILFSLLKQLDKNTCHQCTNIIESANELSIEHKMPYLDSDNPIELFFDLNNIAFSHLSCNSGAARQTKKNNIRPGILIKQVVDVKNVQKLIKKEFLLLEKKEVNIYKFYLVQPLHLYDYFLVLLY